MAESDLSELVSGKSEALDVEYKAWMDTSEPATRAKLARHIAALANHGGGYLIFGVDDRSREPMDETMINRSLFSQDAVSSIIKKYLDPRFQVRVEEAEHAGVRYPVVIVPSHGARPVIAIADGPQVDGKPVGIRQGDIYVRAAGPESVAIRSPDDWAALLDRCLAERGERIAKILRLGLARPSYDVSKASDLLAAAADSVGNTFAEEARQLLPTLEPPYDRRLRNLPTAFCVLRTGRGGRSPDRDRAAPRSRPPYGDRHAGICGQGMAAVPAFPVGGRSAATRP